MVRLALIGFGGYGGFLAKVILELAGDGNCRLVAASDSRLGDIPEISEELTAQGVELFSDTTEMLATLKGRCDGVYVCTGIASHLSVVEVVVRAGFHVHLEKPPAATVQKVDAIVALLEGTDRICTIGFQEVHGDDLQFIKKRIVEGRLGKIQTLSCAAAWKRSASYYSRNEWAGRLRVGVQWVLDGPAMNAFSHQINNMLFLASDQAGQWARPTAVRGELYAANPIEGHDTAAIEIVTDTGARICFLGSHCTCEEFAPEIVIQAEKGKVIRGTNGVEICYSDGTSESIPPAGAPHPKMIANFVEAIERNDQSLVLCKIADARNMVLALNGAYESSRRIHLIDESAIRSETNSNGEAQTVVDGLGELLKAAAAGNCLLSDLPDPPAWTRASEPFELGQYRRFPQQFRGQ